MRLFTAKFDLGATVYRRPGPRVGGMRFQRPVYWMPRSIPMAAR